MSNGSSINIEATIENIEYNPQMCKGGFGQYIVDELGSGKAFRDSTFLVYYDGDKYAFSQWVSPKRTRSYPRARVYDTYNNKNRVTVIPLVKDEGKDGDRDYLQWDTISLMSLLQVYVIVAYYNKAERNLDYDNKITNQEFDYGYIKDQFLDLVNYQSDALHWNLKQVSNLGGLAEKAENAYYNDISNYTGVEMSSHNYFKKRMGKITEKAERFKDISRNLAEKAQNRESVTVQPKEETQKNIDKATITIKNYLGGKYYFTVDELFIKDNNLLLIEKKHTRRTFPSLSDIKNGIVLMVLFTNLDKVKIDGNEYNYKPVLGVTGDELEGYCSNNKNIKNNIGDITKRKKKDIKDIFNEGNKNGFDVYAVSSNNKQKEKEIIETLIKTQKQ